MASGKQYSYDRGAFAISFPGTTLPLAGDTGDEFAILPYVHGEMPYTFAWQISVLNGGTFTSIQVDLQGSLDGTNWYQLDSSTNVAGEMRSITGKKAKYIRAKVVARVVAAGAPYLLVGFAA